MSDYIPLEVLLEILHRLPVKSIVKLISVCKSWKSVITSPTFISDDCFHRATYHSSNSHDTQLRIFFSTRPSKSKIPKESVFSENPNIYSLRYDDDSKCFHEIVKLEVPRQSFSSHLQPLNVCKGLVCLADYTQRDTAIVLWNPAIKKFITIPPPQVYNWVYEFIGFGFDSKANDFKVVGVVKPEDKGFNHGVAFVSPVVKIYSLAKRTWKDHQEIPPVSNLKKHNPQPFIEGAVHWVAVTWNGLQWRCFIFCFDLGNEVFGEIMLPQPYDFVNSRNIFVIGREDSLALVRESLWPPSVDIWVMKEYGVHDSWCKVFTYSLNDVELEQPLSDGLFGFWDLPKVLLLRRGGNLLLLKKSKYLCLLDVETGDHSKDLGPVGDGTLSYPVVDYFDESLFLLDQRNSAILSD